MKPTLLVAHLSKSGGVTRGLRGFVMLIDNHSILACMGADPSGLPELWALLVACWAAAGYRCPVLAGGQVPACLRLKLHNKLLGLTRSSFS